VRKRRRASPPPPPEAKTLGRRIQLLREERGWNQEQLAEAADMDRAYVGGCEIGQRNITLRNLLRFSRAFRISLSDLVDGLK
jgi:transcriptional regulator with XRE-family HTH domain